MKKILILGSAGMAGHMLYKYLKPNENYRVMGVARNKDYGFCDLALDINSKIRTLPNLIKEVEFDFIVNCVGLLIKDNQDDLSNAIFINGWFPHYLATLTNSMKTKVIHLSTDCIFSGKDGPYHEKSEPDGEGNYARTKYLGEINNEKDLTIRMSIIGPELKPNGTGLFQWFMKQQGEIKGYSEAIWNGITTYELAKQIDKLMSINLTGIYNLAPTFDISKCALLCELQSTYCKDDVNIVPDNTVALDKTLITSRSKEYSPNIPSYTIQLKELKEFYN